MKEFDKVIGYASVKRELERLCDVLGNFGKYRALGVSLPRGLLLHGAPGVGKTTMAKCFIEASGRKTFVCRKFKPNGDFVKEIAQTFAEAKAAAPSIVFLDDMDKYANGDECHRNAEEYVTVQSCIDDARGHDVFVLATANDLDNLPRSLLRSGRFDTVIEVERPSVADAEAIVSYYLAQKSFLTDVDAGEIARMMDGKSCADLETVINEAGIIAGYAGKTSINMDDIIRACMRVVFEAPEDLEGYSAEAVERIAYHEAGHAVIAELLEPGSINIVSVCTHTGRTGGVTSYFQSKEYFISQKYMINRVMSLLGGRAATELKYGEIDVGANSDLHRAFDIVTRFVDNYCGFGFDCWTERENSGALLERKEMQVASEMERYYREVRKLLIGNREFLDRLAAELVEKKTITQRTIKAIKDACVPAA